MAKTIDELVVEIRAETAGLRKGLDSLNTKLNRSNTIAKRSIVSFGGLAKAFAAVGAVRLGAGIVNTARSFEDLGATMRAVTGSTQNANKAMSVITDFTAGTPFQLQEVTGAFIKFYQAGITPSAENLTAFGNLAAGMGKDIETLAQAVFNATTGEMEMLKQFGIKAKQMGDEVELTFEGQTVTVDKTCEAIAEYVRSIGAERFPTALAERLATLSGSFSNLQDTAAIFANQIGEAGLTGALTRLAGTLQGTINAAGDEGLATTLGSSLGTAVDKISGAIEYLNTNFEDVMATLKALGVVIVTVATVNILATFVGSLTVLATTITATVIPAIVSATTAMYAFAAAMAVNPITYIVLALAGLVAIGVAIYNNFDELRVFFKNLFTVHIPNFIDKGLIAFNEFKIDLIVVLNDLLAKAQIKINELIRLYNEIPFLDDAEPVRLELDTGPATDKINELNAAIDARILQLETYTKKSAEAVEAVVVNAPVAPTTGNAGTPESGGSIVPPAPEVNETTDAVMTLEEAMQDMRSTLIESTHAFSQDFVKGLLDGQDALASFKDFAKNMVSQIIATFLQLAVVNQILNSIFGLSGTSALPTIGSLGGKAGGGKLQKGRAMLVGERGPEIFVPDTSGTLRNNMDSMNMGGSPVVINQSLNFSTGVVPTVRAEITKMLPQINDMTKAAVLEASARGGSYRKGLLGS